MSSRNSYQNRNRSGRYRQNDYYGGGREYDDYGMEEDNFASDYDYDGEDIFEDDGEDNLYDSHSSYRGDSARTGHVDPYGQTGKGTRNSNRKYSSGKGSSHRNRKKKKSSGPILLIVILIVLMAGGFGVKQILDHYSYSRETADLSEHFGINAGDPSDTAIVWGNELSDIHAKLVDGHYYMKLSDVKDKLNNRFYYGKQNVSDEAGMIMYCFPTDYLTATVGAQEYTLSDGETTSLDYAPALNEDGEIWVSLEFVKQYTNFGMQAFTEPNRLQIDTAWEEQTTATVNRRTQIRTSGGIKSPVLEQLENGDKVTVLEQMDTWSKVKSADSVIGYVENKRLTDLRTETPDAVTDYTEPEFSHIAFDGKINMAFHNVWGSQGNVTLTSYMAPTKDVNIIAPTWYWVSDNDGNMEKACTQDYVDTAHNMGCQVWAVVDNINSESLKALDNHTFLTTLDSRTNLINQLIQEQETYGFDGINVDFELIPEENGEDYIEFIRELSIACRNHGIILSVDNYPSYQFNSHYNVGEQGQFIDYVVIMGYDEHYAGSQEAGSVASISYVSEAIHMAIEEVGDTDRIVNAIPFYSRIWTTKTDGTVTSEAYGMQEIQDYITSHGMTETWDADAGQNYAEMTDAEGNRIQIWVEDAQSVQQKLDVMQADGIKGVAEWRLQFETPDVWDVISNYIHS